MSKIRKNGVWLDELLVRKRDHEAWVDAVKDYYVRTPNISGIPPFAFKSDGENLRDWSMSGQTVQASTPTPANSVAVEGVGERTGNLLDTTGAQSGYITDDGTIVSGHANLMYTDYIAIPASTEYLTQSYDNRATTMDSPSMCFYDSSKTYISGTAFSRATSKTFSVPNNAVYIRTCYRTTASWNMLNTGSAAQPFEPYGYKIPITCGGTTTNIYLGSASTTRRIKKLVLTGEETSWGYNTQVEFFYLATVTPDYLKAENAVTSFCSHYKSVAQTTDASSLNNGEQSFWSGASVQRLYIKDTAYTSIANFKQYLAQQYANGTPVTIWYVLATPETAAVNEPLMKIGSYADEITKTGTGVDIPTVSGSNTLTVNTTVQPSGMTIQSISQWV